MSCFKQCIGCPLLDWNKFSSILQPNVDRKNVKIRQFFLCLVSKIAVSKIAVRKEMSQQNIKCIRWCWWVSSRHTVLEVLDSIFFFENILFYFYLCVCICVEYVHITPVFMNSRGQRNWVLMELESQVVVSHPMSKCWKENRFSVRAVQALNISVTSLCPFPCRLLLLRRW